MIKPTVGRVVWYRQDDRPETEPLAAIIAKVWSDTCVNLAVFDANGMTFCKTSVKLVHDENDEKPSYGYAEWMPFQKGQAAKTEELEKALNKGDHAPAQV